MLLYYYGQNLDPVLRCYYLDSFSKIQLCGYLIKKIYFHPIRKNSCGRILRGEPKEQHLSTIPKFCPCIIVPSR